MTPATLVVDTSAIMAVLKREDRWFQLRATILEQPCIFPAPMLVELWVVARRSQLRSPALVSSFIAEMVDPVRVVAFDAAHADAAALAAEAYGTGNGMGGMLNLFDLMIYGFAKVAGLPILCTGHDFASTDAAIHPASRVG